MDCLPSSADSNGKLFPKTRIESEVDCLGGGRRPVLRPPHLHPLPEHVELPLDVLEGGEGVEVRFERKADINGHFENRVADVFWTFFVQERGVGFEI